MALFSNFEQHFFDQGIWRCQQGLIFFLSMWSLCSKKVVYQCIHRKLQRGDTLRQNRFNRVFKLYNGFLTCLSPSVQIDGSWWTMMLWNHDDIVVNWGAKNGTNRFHFSTLCSCLPNPGISLKWGSKSQPCLNDPFLELVKHSVKPSKISQD